MLVVGDREERDGGVSVREHRAGDTGGNSLKEFAERISRELYSPALKPRKSSERHA